MRKKQQLPFMQRVIGAAERRVLEIAFIAINFGFLLPWLTILTLPMFRLLVYMYVHLAHMEEVEARQTFGDAYDRYAAATPGWFPPNSGACNQSKAQLYFLSGDLQ